MTDAFSTHSVVYEYLGCYTDDDNAEALASGVLAALEDVGAVVVFPQDEESMRAAGFRSFPGPTSEPVWLAPEASTE